LVVEGDGGAAGAFNAVTSRDWTTRGGGRLQRTKVEVEKERNNAQQHACVMNEKTKTMRVPADDFS
jgi:hypothetical protein